MPVPEWFKNRNGKCKVHNCEYVEFEEKKKKGLSYCPKCREESIKKQNEQANRGI